jgi:hypothetical protein
MLLGFHWASMPRLLLLFTELHLLSGGLGGVHIDQHYSMPGVSKCGTKVEHIILLIHQWLEPSAAHTMSP